MVNKLVNLNIFKFKTTEHLMAVFVLVKTLNMEMFSLPFKD